MGYLLSMTKTKAELIGGAFIISIIILSAL